MLSNGAVHEQPSLPAPQAVTVEEVHRQQRAHLAMRALDLEAENFLLQQEVQRLIARVEELTIGIERKPGINVAARSDPP